MTKKALTATKKKHKLSGRYKSREREAYAMIILQLIGFFVFSIYPIMWVLGKSFFDYDGVDQTFIGFENYIRAFTRDTAFWKSVLNTFIISYGKLIIELPLALLAALLLTNKMIKGRKLFSVIFYLPKVTGVAPACMIFAFIFATVNGLVNNALISIGVLNEPVAWLSSRVGATAVIMIQSIWGGFAANVLYFMAGVANIPEDVMEASEIDGANKVQQFFHVTLPMLLPVIKVVLLLAMVGGMQIMNEVLLLTNGGPGDSTNVVMLHIYKMYFAPAGKPEYGYASALGVITSIILGVVTFIYLKFSKKADEVM